MQPLSAAKLKDSVVHILKEHKASKIKSLNVKKLTDMTCYMVIATANSTTHAKALLDKVCRQLSMLKIKPIGVESDRLGEWMLVDFGDVVVHVMLSSVREFYALEKLWQVDKLEGGSED